MRHQVRKKRFDRTSSHRIAMFRNMVTSLIQEERITTTLTKAKELRRFAEKMVTLAKQGSLHARRQAAAYVRTADAVKKLFAELGPRFQERQGGYTRILKLGRRLGDGAPMAIIEYLGYEPRPKKVKGEASTAEAKAEKKEKPTKEKKTDKPAKAKRVKTDKPAKSTAKPAKKAPKPEVKRTPKNKGK